MSRALFPRSDRPKVVRGDWKPRSIGPPSYILPTRNLCLLINADLVVIYSVLYSLSTLSLTGF